MLNPVAWIVSRFRDWKFKRAFDRAPVKLLGTLHVKEVMGNLYAVTLEEIPPRHNNGPEHFCNDCGGRP